MKNIRGYHSLDSPAGPFIWKLRLNSEDSRKLTELEVGMMREKVRPWLEVTRAETGFTLIANTLGSLATGKNINFNFTGLTLPLSLNSSHPPSSTSSSNSSDSPISTYPPTRSPLPQAPPLLAYPFGIVSFFFEQLKAK